MGAASGPTRCAPAPRRPRRRWNGSARFDFTSPALPARVRYAGPILDEPSWSVTWRAPWPEGDARPLVLVGLSSTYQRQAAALRRIVGALSELPVRGLVTLGPAVRPEEVPGSANVVVRAAPHAEVLREASLLVTHCGHGTAVRGLAAGVPLVCLPMGRDQDDTAARVVHRGAGVRLSHRASVARLRHAIARVLADPGYARNARRLGEAISSREGCVDVVEALERQARGGEGRARATALAAEELPVVRGATR